MSDSTEREQKYKRLDTGNSVLAPSGTGTGARWAASGWNTPRAAQWADSRAAWREGIRAVKATPLK